MLYKKITRAGEKVGYQENSIDSLLKACCSTIVERALQKNLFLQNKAKFTQFGQSGRFQPPFLHQKPAPNFTRQKNEPNSNPNEPNFWLLH
jgi:hypothetical protein